MRQFESWPIPCVHMCGRFTVRNNPEILLVLFKKYMQLRVTRSGQEQGASPCWPLESALSIWCARSPGHKNRQNRTIRTLQCKVLKTLGRLHSTFWPAIPLVEQDPTGSTFCSHNQTRARKGLQRMLSCEHNTREFEIKSVAYLAVKSVVASSRKLVRSFELTLMNLVFI